MPSPSICGRRTDPVSDTTLPKPRGRGTWLSVGALLAVLALAVAVNLLADRLLGRARIDLTEQRLYTLSDGTRQVVSNLRDPITLRLFYSRRLGAAVPVFGAYADRVREMLREYVALSDGRIRLEILDPEPFSETEDRALAYGLQAVPLDNAGEQVYFGLAGTNLLDDERTVPFFQPDRERFLEYDLTRLVHELSNPTRPVLGVLSSLPLNGDPRALMMRVPGAGQPFQVMTQLRQFFTVREVAADAQLIPADVQVLMVAHAQDLPEPTLYAIDQFVMRGGKLFALTDPHSESQAARPDPTGRPPASTASNLDRLFNPWGIEAPSDRVVVDQRGAWRVRAGPNDRVQGVDYLAWFSAQGDSLNRTDVASAELSQVTFASAGAVRKREGADLEVTPLVTSSAQSALIEAERVRQAPDPARILAEFRPNDGRHVLLARVRGVLNSAFPDGAPALPEGVQRAEGLPAHLPRTSGPANLVIGNDTDILEDRFWVRVQDFFGQQVATPTSDNGALVANLADTLAGGDSLISLRSRGESLRPFTLVEAMRAEAEARYRQTERGLTERLQATERRLRELRQGPAGNNQAVITPEQRAEIEAARAEIVSTRQQLRAVQRELRQGIEGLESRLRLVNIALVPVLITLFAIGLALLRTRRRAAARG
ncbi:Gldg family protein [Roseomonas sp. SSH11]|uniref:Gldg family protein n=1 Tax=Pararoseomonas baculiformis TaxID=2820812 RepID=A0ABS4ACC6_9PROT|nr:GldG family protein [Pararoseomonas baculiformis]MBP0443904.1 Gldg family protein [Pararoseomonas baculiformis]